MELIETSTFTAQITELLSDEAYAAFQVTLAASPDSGELIPGVAGFAKSASALGHSRQERWRTE